MVFSIVFVLLCAYAIVTIVTVVVDFSTGRYKRLKRLRTSMDEARTEFESRRNRSDKFWESMPSE